jgi:hypothetical protein
MIGVACRAPLIETSGARNIFAEDNFDIDMTDAESVVRRIRM